MIKYQIFKLMDFKKTIHKLFFGLVLVMSCVLVCFYSNIHLPLPMVRNEPATTNLGAPSTRNHSVIPIVSQNASNTTFQPATSMTMAAVKHFMVSSNQTLSNSSVKELPYSVNSSRKNINQSSHTVNKQLPGLILMWNYPWGVKEEGPQEGRKFGKCVFTYKRKLLEKADAVIFPYMNAPTKWPYYRHPRQRFVWFSLEPPWVTKWGSGRDLIEYDNGFFNWTLTYKTDADVYIPYREMMGTFYGRIRKGKVDVDRILAKKTKLVVWLASNCRSKGAKLRLKYVEEMMKTVPGIERYGKCFSAQIPWSEAFKVVASSKFYLAFENSLHCKDYITEKFYTLGYIMETVPVVWGTRKADYLRMAPPHSFIHTDDFSSPEELGKYLLYLDSNATAYREYFKWREDPEKSWDDLMLEVQREHPGIKTLRYNSTGYDLLCDKLFKDERPKVIPSLRHLVFDTESPDCTSKT